MNFRNAKKFLCQLTFNFIALLFWQKHKVDNLNLNFERQC